MSLLNEKDYIYLIWKSPINRRQFIVGELSKNSYYKFNYGFEFEEAKKEGFQALVSFDDANITKIYKNDVLFPVFSSRLPDKKRRDIENILLKYGLKEYDEYELLKRSGARLPIDNLFFIEPIFNNGENHIEKNFYIAGLRHYLGCNGENCDQAIELKLNDELNLVYEIDNQYDVNAIKVLNNKNIHIGYIPRYYAKAIKDLLEYGYKYSCQVINIHKENLCDECIEAYICFDKI